jgi:O-antigen ligase
LVAGIEFWQQSPLLGYGPVAFFGKLTGRELASHNMYAQLLSELGTLGAIAFVWVIYCFWRNVAEARRFSRLHPRAPCGFAVNVVKAVGTTILVMLLMGCSGHNLYRYKWLWMAAFQVVALHCMRSQVGALAASTIRLRLPYLAGPSRPAWATPR